MGGETDLNTLLKGLSPELLSEHYVFVTLPNFSAEQFNSPEAWVFTFLLKT